MALFATLIDLFKGCPKNIKRRLFRDILLILFVTTGAIVSIAMIQGIKTQREISTAIITKANNAVGNHFHNFIVPLGNTMNMLSKWGEAGLLKPQDVNLLATQFQALIEIQPAIHSVTLADADSFEMQLFKTDDQWIVTEHSKETKQRSLWINRQQTDTQEIRNNIKPAAGKTSWFRGAMSSVQRGGYFVSEPYILETTNEPGITLSIRWSPHNNPESNMVSAVSFTMNDLMAFMEQFEVTRNNLTLLLEKDGTILSKHPLISNELLAHVTDRLASNISESFQTSSLKFKGKTWWIGLSQLSKENSDIWVAVLIPEDDIFKDLQEQWKRLALLIGSTLILGIIMTVFLVRRYSHQLKDLPQQQVDMLSYQNEITNLILAGESTSLEFKSTMRANLKTGKNGKEIELAWLKAVVGFMNSDGGILLIGVADDGEILGLDADNFANEDKCRLHFKNLLNAHIGAEYTRFIHLKIVTVNEKELMIIECERVRKPVFLTVGKNEDFFIRSGPSNTKLTMSQMIKYLNER
jgi:hypothetical protein